jgi:PQQ enzyme repeat
MFAATGEGSLIGLDARIGALVWHFQTGGTIASSPIKLCRGREAVHRDRGGALNSFGLPEYPGHRYASPQ